MAVLNMVVCVLVGVLLWWTVSGQMVGESLRQLLEEETKLREGLQMRVNRLRERYTQRLPDTVSCDCTIPTNFQNNSVAFTATYPGSVMSSLTTSTAFVFTGDVSNVGHGYNVSNGRFTAPVSGLYGFSLTIMLPPGYYVRMELVKNGHTFTKVWTGHVSYDRNMAINFIAANLTAGDQVWVKYSGQSDSRKLYGEGVTTFTGYLIHEE